MPEIEIQPIARPFMADFAPPGSKSLSNRALVLAALAQGTSTLRNLLLADDTQVMIDSLRKLGFEISIDQSQATATIAGAGGDIPTSSAQLFCGNSGTTIRFLTALTSLGKGRYELDGVPRMRQRPIGQLVELLGHLGARVEYLAAAGFPPVMVLADRLPGGMIHFGSAQSSQFLSAALMVSPYARHEVRVELIDRQTSWPYVAMTMRLMDHFDVIPELVRDPITHEPKEIIIPRGHYKPADYLVEPDASNATYFLAAAAIHPSATVTIRGLGAKSLQGDVGFADVLRKMGAQVTVGEDSTSVTGPDQLQPIDVDLSDMPDTAQTLAVVALFAEGPTIISGLGTLRVKETDRLAALATELTKLGAAAAIDGNRLTIAPPRELRPAAIDTYDDHRMAMSFAIAGTRIPGVAIRDAQCVGKTYPGFFADLERILIPT